jgi:serine/threonine protein kinase
VTAPAEALGTFRVLFAVLDAATSGFSQACCIGGGGSCAVYKAALYGTTVASKALDTVMVPHVGTLATAVVARAGGGAASNKRLESEARQFAAEYSLLTTVQHPNICRLLGLSSDGARRCLVLEYCTGGGLDKRL